MTKKIGFEISKPPKIGQNEEKKIGPIFFEFVPNFNS